MTLDICITVNGEGVELPDHLRASTNMVTLASPEQAKLAQATLDELRAIKAKYKLYSSIVRMGDLLAFERALEALLGTSQSYGLATLDSPTSVSPSDNTSDGLDKTEPNRKPNGFVPYS